MLSPAEKIAYLALVVVCALIDVGLQRPLFRTRPVVSIFHAFIFFGFSFYLLVNINDILEAYLSGWSPLGGGPVASAFNLFSDLFSVLVLTGMVYFLVRRFIFKPRTLEFNANVKLHPGVAAGGIRRDSLIVGIFILLHVGGRWTGTAFQLAENGHGDPWVPIASLMAPLFYGMSPAALELGVHISPNPAIEN